MKALSVRQPWAFSIFHLGKDIENRSQAFSHRGPLAIHASLGGTRIEYHEALRFIQSIADAPPFPAGVSFPAFDQFQRGGIVGLVDVIDCRRRSESRWFFGPYGLVLANPRPVEFIPCTGRLGLFDIPDELIKVKS